jgi:hypothetical protein
MFIGVPPIGSSVCSYDRIEQVSRRQALGMLGAAGACVAAVPLIGNAEAVAATALRAPGTHSPSGRFE